MTTLITGVLRKKGLIFLNERHVVLNSNGVLSYYHFDKPGEAKGKIDLSSQQVAAVRFHYSGPQNKKLAQGQRPPPDVDDEIRIYLKNRESFIFRASKAATSTRNPTIEKWERVIRKFVKNAKVVI